MFDVLISVGWVHLLPIELSLMRHILQAVAIVVASKNNANQ